MKKITLLIVFLSIAFIAPAQEKADKNTASFELGSGLNFSFNEGDYQFNLSGFIQPAYNYSRAAETDSENEFNSKSSFLIISGKAVNEKVSFLIQTDYSRSEPLLDAWVAYHPFKNTVITVGQKQSFVNNRAMTYREDRLQLSDRSMLSQTFSNTGREFGLFLETKFGDRIGIVPMLAVTSGDGRNSFGSDSRDGDIGGLKIGGRLDLYPAGYFSEGNDLFSADLAHEETPKFVIGAAFSTNEGASSSTGEGHGDFFLYDADGNESLPDYSQLYLDFLLKYKGFSLLAEYVDASAKHLDLAYTDENASTILIPTQISEFLVLGESYSIQTGYVTKKGLSFDLRYESVTPEFDSNTASILGDTNSYTFGVTKYFDNNNLKMQASFSKIEPSIGTHQSFGEFLIQILF